MPGVRTDEVAKGSDIAEPAGEGAQLMDIKEKEYIIVGSGPGGATVAEELSKREKKALILEMVGPMAKRLMESAQNLNLCGLPFGKVCGKSYKHS